MPGYTNPYVLLQFPDLGDDVSVLMRNPQLLPPRDITPEDVPLDANGQPSDPQAAQEAMYRVFARVIVAWKVYDPNGAAPPEIGPDADPIALFEQLRDGGGQPRLGDITPENIARLPMRITTRIMEEISRVADPQ
ncbi:hypothetical protein [Streptomyces mobaraensis]|uniref:Uncharacterized protein n=1 Tax=Streptomyces mobaraensis TaxID=35621 RepID=A0A5N5WCR5_STRMB|nr:hypothetical protein [Streptomyces mobaraensis]KAB7850121.1 hypothetical protein FRZ00_05840 [Streptomyces mobaraensis]